MKTSPMPGRTFQFGVFEVNESSGELRKHGVKIRVQEQPFQILVLLLERPNEIVGREEIRARLWPENTFVDFDNAISNAVRRLREALSDSADNPRFIETLSRRGYRFIGQVAVRSPTPPVQTPPVPKPPAPKPTRIKVVPIAVGSLILGVASWWLWTGRKPDATQLTPLPLTAAPGWEWTPSFSPDGSQIAYAWDKTETGKTSHIYIKLLVHQATRFRTISTTHHRPGARLCSFMVPRWSKHSVWPHAEPEQCDLFDSARRWYRT